MQKLIFFIIILFLQLTSFGQIKIGQTANLSQMNLTSINGAKLDASKLIVLDFWATWCGPCIASFPHLDSLQKKYRKQIQVAAVSDEPIAKVSNFLKKRKYEFGFFTDQSKSVFTLFDIESRPTTAVLSSQGNLLWIGSLKQDLDFVLQELISKKTITSFPKVDYSFQKYYFETSLSKTHKAVYDYQISQSDTSEGFEAKTQKGDFIDSAINIYYRATSVTEIIQDMLVVPDLQFHNRRPELENTLVNLTAKSTSPKIIYKNESKRIVEDLKNIFNFSIKEEYNTIDSYTLTSIDQDKLSQFEENIPGGGMVEPTDQGFKVIRLSLEQLANFLQKKTKTFMFYDGTNTFKYNLTLKKFSSVQELNAQLKNDYGLTLTPVKTKVRFVELF